MISEHPTSPVRRPAGRESGFTLIELAIVMVVAAILSAIAIPMYMSQVRESRRTDARSALLDLAGREERYYATNNAYTDGAVNLGYGGWGAGYTIGSGYYYLDEPVVTAGTATTPPSYSVTAVATSSQVADTCATFTITSTGQQTATLSSGGADTTGLCWGSQ